MLSVKFLVCRCDADSPASEAVHARPHQLWLPIWLIHNEAGAPDESLRKLAQQLHQPCYGLAMPQDCSGLHSIEGLAERYLQRIVAVQGMGPYVLVGCSVVGSLVASAVTRQLER